MSVEIESLNSYCGLENLSGLFQFFYVPTKWIATFPECPNDAYEYTTPITFIPTKDWIPIKVPRDTIQFREVQANSKQGKSFNQTLNAFFPGWNAAISQQFNLMRQDRFIIRIVDRDGAERIFGDLDYPLTFSSSLSSSGAKGHSIQFLAQNPNKVYTYNI